MEGEGASTCVRHGCWEKIAEKPKSSVNPWERIKKMGRPLAIPSRRNLRGSKTWILEGDRDSYLASVTKGNTKGKLQPVNGLRDTDSWIAGRKSAG